MSNVNVAVEAIRASIEGKKVLEVACGSAEFAEEAAKIAEKVDRIEASKLENAAPGYDTVVMYNVMGSLEDMLGQVMAQCRRLIKPEGDVYVISTRMMDKFAVEQTLLPALVEGKTGMSHKKTDVGSVTIVHIK